MILGENFGWLSSGSIYRSSFSKEYLLVINLGAKTESRAGEGHTYVLLSTSVG